MNHSVHDFLTRLKTFKRLPTLPHMLAHLLNICRDQDMDLRELSRMIALDTGLTGRVLYIANSSSYRDQEKVFHLEQALSRLSRKTIKNLVYTSAVQHVFHDSRGYDSVHLKSFWRHSLLTAILGRMIARRTNYPEPDQAFFAGMVHDIGRIILHANFPEAYAELLDFSPHDLGPLLEGERRIGAPHTEVGAWLLSQWNLDSFTIDAVLYHHEPAERIANAFPLVKIVYVANILAEMTESSEVGCDEIMSLLSLDLSETAELMVRAEREMETLAQSLGIDIELKTGPSRPDDDHERKNRELVNNVGDMAMLFGTLQDLTEAMDEDTMLLTLHEGIRILFDTPAVLLFLNDSDRRSLVNYGDAIPGRVIIPLDLKTTLPVRCLADGAIISSFSREDGTVTIVDEQLARLLGKAGLVCAPLIAHNEQLGVVAIGVDEGEASYLQSRYGLLKLFTHIASATLHSERLRRNDARQMQEEQTAAISSAIRRIVHEINNPIGIIKNFLVILGSKLGESGSGRDEIRLIGDELDRVKGLLAELSSARNK